MRKRSTKIEIYLSDYRKLCSDLEKQKKKITSLNSEAKDLILEQCQLETVIRKLECCANCKHYIKTQYDFLFSFGEDCKVHGDPLVGVCLAWEMKESK